MTIDLASRIQRLEDRTEIVEVVVRYATSIDAADWATYSTLFTDPMHVDFSEAGLPVADFPRDQFVAFAQQGLEPWDARQHLSPNHVVEFDDADPDTAVCRSYMFAQTSRLARPTSCAGPTSTRSSARTPARRSAGSPSTSSGSRATPTPRPKRAKPPQTASAPVRGPAPTPKPGV